MDPRFYLCNRGIVINLEHAVDFDGKEFLLDDETRIPVSRKLIKDARQTLWIIFSKGDTAMNQFLRPFLELTVILPGMFLAYLPVSSYLRQKPLKLTAWLFPLLLGLCISGGFCPVSFKFQRYPFFSSAATAPVSLSQDASDLHLEVRQYFLAVCAVFACINSLSRAVNAITTANLNLTENELWFQTKSGLFYNAICLSFALATWYPASHAAKKMIDDENFARTWYIFWILPLTFIGLNLFMVPRYRNTLYTGRILHGYIVISLVLLAILVLFYAMFLLMADSLNRNARLQQENHFLSLQQARYDNLRAAIEEARQARHDIRHHFLQLSVLAENGDLEKIKEYLSHAASKIPNSDLHFCENQAVDSVLGYYSALAKRENIPFQAKIDLPPRLAIDEIDLCLVLSNLLENALEASQKTNVARRKIDVMICLHHTHLLLIQVENTFDGKIEQKNTVFQSSNAGNGIGIQSVAAYR